MHQNGIENATHNKQLCIPTVLDMAGRNMDLTVTCARYLDNFELIVDQLNGLKFKQQLQSQLKNKMCSTRR